MIKMSTSYSFMTDKLMYIFSNFTKLPDVLIRQKIMCYFVIVLKHSQCAHLFAEIWGAMEKSD